MQKQQQRTKRKEKNIGKYLYYSHTQPSLAQLVSVGLWSYQFLALITQLVFVSNSSTIWHLTVMLNKVRKEEKKEKKNNNKISFEFLQNLLKIWHFSFVKIFFFTKFISAYDIFQSCPLGGLPKKEHPLYRFWLNSAIFEKNLNTKKINKKREEYVFILIATEPSIEMWSGENQSQRRVTIGIKVKNVGRKEMNRKERNRRRNE